MPYGYPAAYGSVNPAVGALFANEMAINRASAADALAQQQLQAERERQAAENIYRREALRQQSEQAQLNAFLNVLSDAQRQQAGREELAGRERIARYPYSEEVSGRRLKELQEEIAGRERIAKASIPPALAVEQIRQLGDKGLLDEERRKETAAADSLAASANQRLKGIVDKFERQRKDLESKGVAFGWLRPQSGFLGKTEAKAPEAAKLQEDFQKELNDLIRELTPHAGQIIFRNNRFEPNVPVTVPQAAKVLRAGATVPAVPQDGQPPTLMEPESSERILVESPQGIRGTIPAWRWPYYQMIGYTRPTP